MAEKRIYIVMAELSKSELDVLRILCRREQRSTGFLGGRIIHERLQQHSHREGRNSDDSSNDQ